MCIGIPMQVEVVEDGFVVCYGRGERRRISTLLIGDCVPGEWLLTFIDDAREKIDAVRAGEINSVLDMLEGALGGGVQSDVVDFVLPSSMNANELAKQLHIHDAVLNERPV